MRRGLTLITAALLVTALFAPVASAAGPSAPAVVGPADAVPATAEAGAAPAPATEAERTEPRSQNGELGCWEGVCHNDSIDVDQSDGLNDEELERLVHRSMARVEFVRERPFQEDVPVETMTREEYQRTVGEGESDAEFNRWNDQVWKALFIVGEDQSSEESLGTVFGGSVAGFYSPTEDRIVIVVPEGEEVRISPATLVHELVHGMQDQYHNLSAAEYSGDTQDADLAIDGIVEGEASYIEARYTERCESGEWDCVDEPDSDGGGGVPEGFNWGIYLTVFQPYSDGTAYVHEIVRAEGWEGVTARMENPPTAAAQTIHRNDSIAARDVEFEDTAENGWEPYPEQGVEGADTVGEASIYAMFWYQNREYDAPTFDWRETLLDTSHPYEEFNYGHESSAGWAGDELHPYRNDAGDAEQDGYVWVTEWQTPADAAEFEATYRAMVEHHVERNGGRVTDEGVYVVPEGDFRGAYGIAVDGTTVTIVHAPEAADVFDLRPGIEADEPATETPTETETDTDTPTEADADTDTPTETETGEEVPGFGIVAALVALAASALALRRR